MNENEKIDLGSVKIHKKVLAEIVDSSVSDVQGISFKKKNFILLLLEMLGYKFFPGIKIIVGKENEVNIEVHVFVRYGLKIPDVATQIQEVIKTALDRAVNINLKQIDVNILGIERA